MKFFNLILMLFYIFVWIPVQKSSITGRKCNAEEFPSLVVIINALGPFCGGTILNGLHVISAASCTEQINSEDTISVLAGDVRVGLAASGSRQRSSVRKTLVHPNYEAAREKNDIVIFILAKSLKLNGVAVSAALLSSQSPEIDTKAIVAGWGSWEKPSSWRKVCHTTEFTVLNREKCEMNLPKRDNSTQILKALDATLDTRPIITPDENQICAANIAETNGSYVGDYGGPLYIVNQRNQLEIVGIASYFGVKDFTKVVYVDIAHHKNWIKTVIGSGGEQNAANEGNKSDKIDLFIIPTLILGLKLFWLHSCVQFFLALLI